ncbi:MAG: hypothetical protein QXK24_00900 [Ignisphaera sp.]|uniref:Uncharacterized protein n=1 Tax=Ignisphaera aggregans TaxID=334771 RepID=A0A7C4D1A3_9CREN
MNIPDYTTIFGIKEGIVVRMLIENRPKWLLLILYLRKFGAMTLSEIMSRLNIHYGSIKNAIKYLAGVDLKTSTQITSHITPLGVEPLLYVIRIPTKKKIVTLTDYGLQFSNKIVDYLKDIAIKLGSIDVEAKYGIPKIILLNELKQRFPNIDKINLLTRLVSFDELIVKLAKTKPELVSLMRPELIDAIPIELEVAVDSRTSRKIYLYLVL